MCGLIKDGPSKRNCAGQLIDYRTKLIPRIIYRFMRPLLYLMRHDLKASRSSLIYSFESSMKRNGRINSSACTLLYRRYVLFICRNFNRT